MNDDWATTKALEIIAARKLTTKIMHDDDGTPFGTITADTSVPLIAEALREERERCAQVADAGAVDGDWDPDCCRGIAAQIRDPESAEPQL